MRLIDADALKYLLGGVRAYYNCFDEDERKFYEAYSKAIEILDIYLNDAPTIDAVEVVRCDECKYRETCEQIVWFDIGKYKAIGSEIDYCSYGEREGE